MWLLSSGSIPGAFISLNTNNPHVHCTSSGSANLWPSFKALRVLDHPAGNLKFPRGLLNCSNFWTTNNSPNTNSITLRLCLETQISYIKDILQPYKVLSLALTRCRKQISYQTFPFPSFSVTRCRSEKCDSGLKRSSNIKHKLVQLPLWGGHHELYLPAMEPSVNTCGPRSPTLF